MGLAPLPFRGDQVRNASRENQNLCQELVHEVLPPGIQRAQWFLPMQGQPNPAPFCGCVWTEPCSLLRVCLDGKRLIALFPNGWLPAGI